MGMGMNPDDAPVKFIHKPKVNYGTGESAENYDSSVSSGQSDAGLEEIADVVEDGVEGYRSLTADGSMDSGEATAAVTKAVLVIGFLLIMIGIVLVNVVF